jgi:predicted phage baseplate assembly protein
MLDDGAWRRVAGYRRVDESGNVREFVHADYASGRAATIRFGDGDFGLTPDPATVFEVVYRLGHERVDNVATGSLTDFDPPEVDPANLNLVSSVTNPFDAIDAIAAQAPAEVRQLAPEAFRAITFRAVRPEDYAEAVERLPWVQRAGARFRWTGSWLTVFATPDPKGSFTLTPAEEIELAAQLDRFRLAGREAWGLDPVFAIIDLEINICIEPSSFVGDVVAAVLEALFGRRGLHPVIGFFSPDKFTFGTPLERGRLEAAIQSVPGVRAVEAIRLRRRGWFDWRDFTEAALPVADNEIIRVENRPEVPERGAVRIIPHGGA